MSQSSPKHKPVPKKGVTAFPKPVLFVILAAVGALIVGALLLVFRGSSATSYTPEVTGAPSLKIEQEVLDYGDVKFNEPVEAVFNLKNVGDQPLNITQIPQVQILQGC